MLAAALLQCLTSLDNDVSWLLTVAEHVLDGNQLYVDIIETNPPASVLLYLPAVATARLLAAPAEPVTAAFTFGFAALAIGGTARMLIDGGMVWKTSCAALLSVALFLFLLLPAACFAQREHFAVVAMLPMLGVASLRAEGRAVSIGGAVGAGLGAGLTLAIKPHFVLAIGPMILFAIVRQRSWRPAVGAELCAALAVVIAYVTAVALLFPVYLQDMLPILRETYLRSRAPPQDLWFSAPILLQASVSVVTLWLTGRRSGSSRAVLPLIAATGFAAALIVQGKGYLNHGYPGDALALLALAIALAERHAAAAEQRFAGTAFVGLSGVTLWFFAHIFNYDALTSLVERVAPSDPRIIVAGADLGIGHPLTRRVKGEWIGRSPSLWLTGIVTDLLGRPPGHPWTKAERLRLLSFADRDRRQFVEDIMRRHANVVLVEGAPAFDWIRTHPDVAAALTEFRPAGSAAGVSVLVRAAAMTRAAAPPPPAARPSG